MKIYYINPSGGIIRIKDHFEYYGSTLDCLCRGEPYNAVKRRVRILKKAGIIGENNTLTEPRVLELYRIIDAATRGKKRRKKGAPKDKDDDKEGGKQPGGE